MSQRKNFGYNLQGNESDSDDEGHDINVFEDPEHKQENTATGESHAVILSRSIVSYAAQGVEIVALSSIANGELEKYAVTFPALGGLMAINARIAKQPENAWDIINSLPNHLFTMAVLGLGGNVMLSGEIPAQPNGFFFAASLATVLHAINLVRLKWGNNIKIGFDNVAPLVVDITKTLGLAGLIYASSKPGDNLTIAQNSLLPTLPRVATITAATSAGLRVVLPVLPRLATGAYSLAKSACSLFSRSCRNRASLAKLKEQYQPLKEAEKLENVRNTITPSIQ